MLVEVAKILKKDEDGNPQTLSNREKTIVIDVLRKSFKLKDLLEVLELSKSSYFYQRHAQARADKYAQVKEQIDWDEGTENGPDRSALLGHNFVYQETKSHGFYSSYFHQRISS